MNHPPPPRLIHDHFELSYATHLVLQRSILQSMPDAWQAKFVVLLDELDAAARGLPDLPTKYRVLGVGRDNRFVCDPYTDYQRGRRRVPLAIEGVVSP